MKIVFNADNVKEIVEQYLSNNTSFDVSDISVSFGDDELIVGIGEAPVISAKVAEEQEEEGVEQEEKPKKRRGRKPREVTVVEPVEEEPIEVQGTVAEVVEEAVEIVQETVAEPLFGQVEPEVAETIAELDEKFTGELKPIFGGDDEEDDDSLFDTVMHKTGPTSPIFGDDDTSSESLFDISKPLFG